MFIVFDFDYETGYEVLGLCDDIEIAKTFDNSSKIEEWIGMAHIADYYNKHGKWKEIRY